MATNAAGYVGVKGTVAYKSGGVTVASTTNRLVGANLTAGFTKVELKNGQGDIIGVDAITKTRRATLEWIPYDSTGNPTTAAGNVKVPDALSVVTVASSNIAALDGDWNVVDGFTITPNTDGYLRCSCPVEQYGTYGSETSYAALT